MSSDRGDSYLHELQSQGFITEQRQKRLESRAMRSSNRVVCVFENTHHCHNVNAVLRTIEALGFLDAIMVYSNPKLRWSSKDTVSRGASRWLHMSSYPLVSHAGEFLRSEGFQVALVSLPTFAETGPSDIRTLPFVSTDHILSPEMTWSKLTDDRRLALVFGAEKDGVDPDWVRYADTCIGVPLDGFAESLNVSVCAGMLLHSLRNLGQRTCTDWFCNERERRQLLERWVQNSLPRKLLHVIDPEKRGLK